MVPLASLLAHGFEGDVECSALPVVSADPGHGQAEGQEGEGGGGWPLSFRHRLHR